jgi:diacylglycerol kinase family enzyme
MSPVGGAHEVAVMTPPEHDGVAELERRVAGSDALVIAGGDGSVYHNAPIAMRAGVPIYHLPCGNENLFAREFGMTRSEKVLGRAIAAQRTRRVDVGRMGDSGHFVIMASFGLDASVIHRLTKVRSRASGHLAYVGPMLAEIWRPTFPRLSVVADGKMLVEDRRGVLIIANCRQYALRLNPLHRASMTDGVLDVLFMPCESRWSVVSFAAACAMRSAERRPGAVHATARQVVVTAHEGTPYQVDGEAVVGAGDGGVLRGEMRFGVDQESLTVLMPRDA